MTSSPSEATRGGPSKSTSLPDLMKTMGKTGCSFPGTLPYQATDGSLGEPRTINGVELRTTKDLIKFKAKGNVGAPWATREDQPIAGKDIIDIGGAYRSYYSMRLHRYHHTRTVNGPNERFGDQLAPPISSYDHGFGKQTIRPPKYPISSTWISRSAAEIQKSLGPQKKG
mmetsp:Transcript_16935/g.36447  ORF Transcript_16935/g.36447 Transcript_16935/m.36447 type:complete len:170 (+) Transcript_16935:117-626(+)